MEGAPDRFGRLISMLDGDLRMITPTVSEEVEGESVTVRGEQIVRYYQLTHDYLVPSIRGWLNRKQRETRRGRAELRLADRSAIWAAKPENRQLPSFLEWSNIRLLTESNGWTEPHRKMMQRAGRVRGLEVLGLAAFLAALIVGGLNWNRSTHARGLVDQVLKAKTAQVPGIVDSMKDYRPRVAQLLKDELGKAKKGSSAELHARLALLSPDAADAQVDPLCDWMLEAEDPEVATVIGKCLEAHSRSLTEKLWITVEQATPGKKRILPAACALARYDPMNPRWAKVSEKVARALVSVDTLLLRPWVEALSPVRSKLTVPLATIFREKSRSKSAHSVETDILIDYASEDPNLIADLLMDSDQKAYLKFFPIVVRQQEQTLPLFRKEIDRKLTFSWNDPPFDPSWTKPDATLTAKIESAQGMLTERFAFCQTMPLDEFVKVAEALRKSGYRPIRFRPYAEGKSLRVAAVWTRDGRPWRMAHDQTADEIRQTDEQNRKEGYLPVEVAGYLAAGGMRASRPPASPPCGCREPDQMTMPAWSWRHPPPNSRRSQEQLKKAGLVPLTLHAWRQADDKLSYSGVWHKTATGTSDTASSPEWSLGSATPRRGCSAVWLPDRPRSQCGTSADRHEGACQLRLCKRRKPPSRRTRMISMLGSHRRRLTYSLARARRRLTTSMPSSRSPRNRPCAYQYRAIAHARLGHKDQARADLEKFEIGNANESQKLYLAVIVAAELGQGTDEAIGEARSGPQEPAPGFRTPLRCRLCLRPGISGCCPEGPGEE